MRGHLVLPVLLLLAACQPEQPPGTAAPASTAPAGIARPAPDAIRRYDKAIVPVDETRTARSVTPARPAPPRAGNERERRAIEAWEKEEAAASRSALTVVPPPRSRAGTLSAPSGNAAALPRPTGDARATPAADAAGELAAPPSAAQRPEVKVPALPAKAPEVAPPAAPVAQQAEPAVAESAPVASPPPVRRATPTTVTAAAPAGASRLPPGGQPLTTVLFSPRSADLSEQARVALAFFAQDPNTQRLRRLELWAGSSAENPAEAGKIAFARALAVHAYLIDLGVRARIEIGGYSETGGASPDRVDLMTR